MGDNSYRNLDLVLERSGRVYRTRIQHPPAGEFAPSPFRLPFSNLQLETFLLRFGRPRAKIRGFGKQERKLAKEFGEPLFNVLFRDQFGACLRSSLEIARSQSMGLRLR